MNRYFPRNLDAELLAWAKKPEAKPLVLRGGRQTGKSTTIRKLGESFDLFLELNLDRQVDLQLLRSCESGADLLSAIAARRNVAVIPPSTLLFIDEIQESAKAIAWLREFKEDHSQLHVIAAGSLLEVRLEQRGFSFPVGRVTFRTLHPFSFFEFLHATNRGVLADRIEEAVLDLRGPARALHDQALEALREYACVGGMPEAVAHFSEGASLTVVRQVHADLLEAFAEDIQKYRGVRNTESLEAAYSNLAQHYGQRFHYENFAPGLRSREMKAALERFESAMIVTRVMPTSSLDLPIRTRPKSAPKLLSLDIGLALHSISIRFDTLSDLSLGTVLDGRAAELLVGQQILAAQNGPREAMHFWVRESARANAEIDFLIPGGIAPMPVEVKAGSAGTLRSVHQFLKRAKQKTAIRLSTNELLDEQVKVRLDGEILAFRLVSLPLYAAELVPMLARQFPHKS